MRAQRRVGRVGTAWNGRTGGRVRTQAQCTTETWPGRRHASSANSGSRKDTQTPRRINISTPSVADVKSNNSNNKAVLVLHQRISLLAHPHDCCRVAAMRQRCAARQPQAAAHTARQWRTSGPRRAHTTMERRATCSVHQPEGN